MRWPPMPQPRGTWPRPRDPDLADLAVTVDANRTVINGLGQQARERFDEVDRRLDAVERRVDIGFAEIRGTSGATAAGSIRSPACSTG